MYLAWYYYCMKNNRFRQFVIGSSANLPAHWEGGARARFQNVAAKKFARPREDGSAGGGWGEECRAVRA